jgi:hypothetical protein
MKIIKDEIEVNVESPITKLREDLQNLKIDFSVISHLRGEKNLLVQSFRETFAESINE